MSKGQHGNKEAKKPKQPKALVMPVVPGAALPVVAPQPSRFKKK